MNGSLLSSSTEFANFIEIKLDPDIENNEISEETKEEENPSSNQPVPLHIVSNGAVHAASGEPWDDPALLGQIKTEANGSWTESTETTKRGWSSDDETEGVKRSKKIKVESDEEWVPSSGENSRSRRKTAPAKKRSGTASKKTESVHKDKRPVKISDNSKHSPSKDEQPYNTRCPKCLLSHRKNSYCPMSGVFRVIANEDSGFSGRMAVMKTLPSCLYFGKVCDPGVEAVGVFTSKDLGVGTRLGPMEGELIHYANITNKMDMEHIWILEDNYTAESQCLSMKDESKANWLRYIRLDHSRKPFNLMKIVVDEQSYVVTSEYINQGTELILRAEEHHIFRAGIGNNFWGVTVCPQCDLSFRKPLFLQRHLYLYHNGRMKDPRYICQICGEIIFGHDIMKRHSQVRHNLKTSECFKCNYVFQSAEALGTHKSKCTKKIFMCSECGRGFPYADLLEEHMKNPKMCKNRSLVQKYKIQHSKNMAHRNKQLQNRALMQGIKTMVSKTMKQINKNQQIKTLKQGDEKPSNEGADRESFSKQAAFSTVRVPTVEDERKYCDKCGQECRDILALKMHMLGHTGLRRFKCTVEGCVSAYNQRVCMRRHYTNVHHFTDETMPDIVPEFRFTLDACMGDVPGRETFKCKQCFRVYFDESELEEHVKEDHPEDGKVVIKTQCVHCGKLCHDMYDLKVHLLSHSKVKPFKCQEEGCPIAYSTKHCLQKHYMGAHKYTKDTIPEIFRSVPFTVDAHLGDSYEETP